MKGHESIFKQSQYYIELREELVVLFNLSNAPREEIAKRAGISTSHLWDILAGKKRLLPNRAKDILRAIIEIQNYRATKSEARRN
ncbi:hypothetical protein [uncultured Draconibacterium sp.]|uniref:hypothetical protein n=1 Tax=uncultured Draconibacterium sp. TaxID=1573823 RepID=UPI002622F7E6|nr:hypothetical protein [uncultured Draconibacterium sp.]